MNYRRLDPYAVLGVEADASAEEIRSAYRRLLRRHHPDTRDAEDDPSIGPGESVSSEKADRDSSSELRDILDAYAQVRAASKRPTRPIRPLASDLAAPEIIVLPTRWWRL